MNGKEMYPADVYRTHLLPHIITLKTVNVKRRHIERNPLIDNQYLKKITGKHRRQGKISLWITGQAKKVILHIRNIIIIRYLCDTI